MHSPRLRLVGVLLTLTGVSLVALIVLGWRSLNRFEAEIVRVLRQACVYTAQETAQQIQRDFKSPVFNLLEQVDHPAIKNFHLPKIVETLRNDGAPHFQLIDAFFVWSLTPENETTKRPFLFYSRSYTPSAESAEATPAYARELGFFLDPEREAILEDEARRFAPLGKNFALTYPTLDGRTYHAVYHFLYDEADRRQLWGFEGFVADTEHLRQHYFPRVVSKWRAEETKAAAFPALAVSIFDDHGREVSRSGRSLLQTYEAEARFPFLFFDTDLLESLSPFRPEVRYWTVRTGYEAGDIYTIARQEGMQQRWAWVLVGLVAVVGIALTARGTARELRLSEMKSEFVASVSHELRTPLAKIQLFADTLESGRARTPEKVEAYNRVISAQARKLSQLIAELLDFSKIDAGVRDYPLEELDLREVLRSSIEMFDHELSQDGYTVEIDLDGGEVPVLGNRDALQQLFGNLIGNAVKYSTRARFLRVALTTVDGHARIEVTDRGIGIPRREQRKIFKKFYRGSGALALGATGSGIGLSIVDHVLRAHGGSVSVTSVPGEGSTFTVQLPILTPEV